MSARSLDKDQGRAGVGNTGKPLNFTDGLMLYVHYLLQRNKP